MKIVKIEIVDGIGLITGHGHKLFPVKLTLRNWLGKEKEIKAFPTNIGPTFGGPNILYFYYCDETGKRLKDEYSEQINNYIKVLYFELEN